MHYVVLDKFLFLLDFRFLCSIFFGLLCLLLGFFNFVGFFYSMNWEEGFYVFFHVNLVCCLMNWEVLNLCCCLLNRNMNW